MAATGYTPILIYASGTTTNVPLAANMTSSASGAELAINYADGKLFYKDSGGTVQVLATKGTAAIGGSNTQVQYNSSGSLAGSANLTFDGTSLTMGGNPILSAGTANGVAYLNGSKVLTSGSALTYNGSTLQIGGANPQLNVSVTSGAQDTYTYFNNTNFYNYINFQNNGTTFGFLLAAYGTGMFYNFDNQIWRSNAGSEYMRLTSTGLGIGTSSPNRQLTLTASSEINSTSTVYHYFGPNGTNLQGFIGYNGNGDTDIGARSAYGISFKTAQSGAVGETMRLTASGNLGLGVTPSAKLDVQTTSGRFQVLAYGGASVQLNSSAAMGYKSAAGNGHIWNIDTTQAMTLDASGNLRVNNSASLPAAHTTGNINCSNDISTGSFLIGVNGSFLGRQSSDGSTILNTGQANLIFSSGTYGSTSERARIDSSGNLLVGTTSQLAGTSAVSFSSGNGWVLGLQNTNNSSVINITNNSGTASYTAAGFYNNGSSYSACGSITVSGSSTAFNTTSDYRLKTLIGQVTGSGERIDALNPVEYEWKTDGKRARGFFAHEFQSVYADSVTGEKDAVDEEGKPVYQAMQAGTSEVIADLVAEIKSLRQRITALEGK